MGKKNIKERRKDSFLKNDIPYVLVKRDMKEYLGESLLIVFSVLLALFVTESINKLHERQKTKILLKSIVNELKNNRKSIQEMQVYNLQVLGRVDSALKFEKFQKKIVSKDEFHLDMIAPDGILYRFLGNIAWTVAKNNDIMTRLDIQSLSLLTKVYEDQERIGKMEDEVAKVLFDRNSRDSKQIHSTLILIRDNYKGWAVDRIPGLLIQIDEVIREIDQN